MSGKIKKIIMQVIFGDFIFKLFPVKKDVVLFSSFFGQHYSDGPRAISEKLHEAYPEIKIYWAFNNKNDHLLPEYVESVNMNSLKYIFIKSIAKFSVSNVYLQSAILGNHRFKNLLTRIHLLLEKRNQQIRITTWHGTPLKRMGNDEIGASEKLFICNKPLYYVVGNQFECDIMMRLTNNCMEYLPWGNPRTTKLRCVSTDEVRRIKSGIGISEDTRVVLFAPTFRYGKNKRGVDVLNSGIAQLDIIQFDTLKKVLADKFGGQKWVLVCRFHNLVEQSIDWETINSKYPDLIINGNVYEDIMDYYICSDIVITDYSSVMFDYMMCNKPVILLCHDYINYCDNERGFYLSLSDLPFIVAHNHEQLVNGLKCYDNESYKKQIELFQEKLGYYENSEDVLQRICNFIYFGTIQ